MTLLALLFALGISQAWPDVERWRQTDWLSEPSQWLGGRGPGWLPVATTLIAALLAGALLAALAATLLGSFGLLLAGTAVLLFVLGPRDLARDVEAAARGGEESAMARLRLRVDAGARADQGAAAVLHAALARWFGVLFWFALLGIPGALVYRAVREARHLYPAGSEARPSFDAVLGVLNWPVVALMTLSVALMTDFDRVLDRFDARSDRWHFPVRLLDDLAVALCTAGETDPDPLATGLHDGHQLVRRVLALWLAVVAVLLLIGVIA